MTRSRKHRIRREVFLHVVADQLLDFPVLGIGFGDNIAGVFIDQRLAGGEHLRADEIERSAR